MKILKFVLFTCCFFTLSNAIAQCGSNKKAHQASYSSHTSNTVVDIALESEIHKTLVAALKAADLVEALQDDGPFTVFAPTDNAFGKIPSTTLNNLLQASQKKALQNILTYHVIPAEVTASTLLTAIEASGGAYTIKTLSGGNLIAKVLNNEAVLEDEKGNIAIIRNTDLKAGNGIIHVIDSVVLPK